MALYPLGGTLGTSIIYDATFLPSWFSKWKYQRSHYLIGSLKIYLMKHMYEHYWKKVEHYDKHVTANAVVQII